MAATLVITIVTPQTVADVTDQLLGVGTITADSNAIDRVARYVDAVATGAFKNTSVVTSIS
jgi:hypothetical protein